MSDRWIVVRGASNALVLSDIREALSRAGLALVPAADVVTPEERAILRECEALDDATLHAPIVHADMLYPLCDAIQRARRVAKEANRG